MNQRPLFETAIVRRALGDALRKLDPRHMAKNPVMFVVEVGSLFTTVLFAHAVATGDGAGEIVLHNKAGLYPGLLYSLLNVSIRRRVFDQSIFADGIWRGFKLRFY